MNEETVANHKALYLTDVDKAIATKVVASITKIVQVDTIFVLGKKVNTAQNIFMPECGTGARTSAFWLLTLITGDDKRHKMYQDEIEQKCNSSTEVSCIVMQTSTFVRWFNEKDSFALTVLSNAPFICNTNPELEEWKKETVVGIIPATDKKAFQKCFDLCNEYLAGAELFTVRKQYRLALFMYHLATELLLTAFIKSQTGLELHIHNINHLNQYLSFLAPGIAADFWGATQKEQEAFRLLQKSYCSARYDADFEVGYAQLEIVRQKVSRAIQELKEISSLIFKEAGRFPRLNIV
ncbi:HEPN domain-containing protein [Niabella sp. CC-SYL272]|uniref:HEPN domain-containing protein n=1 Tax=Niabella agricola TaxID=2891571 RepID=UPI001F1A0208|nr:HEPN domain-containing protein [Niabella agricola]MCF3107551.1 HEPN domain-containing protein [Niabella agricola]